MRRKINTDTEPQKRLNKDAKRRVVLETIRKELEAETLDSFQKMFAIISETRVAIEMNMSFYTLRKKVEDPGEFTYNEAIRLAELFGVDYDAVAKFLFSNMKAKPKEVLPKKKS